MALLNPLKSVIRLAVLTGALVCLMLVMQFAAQAEPGLTMAVSQPTPSPEQGQTEPQPKAVIEAIVVNGQSVPQANSTDIELIRSGQQTPLSTVEVGTKLNAGDEIRTKAEDQLTLRDLEVNNGQDNLVYMDPETSIYISSFCIGTGRALAQVGIRFRLCWRNTDIDVDGTEFVVTARNNQPLEVSVIKGAVRVKPKRFEESKKGIVSQGKAAPPPSVQLEQADKGVVSIEKSAFTVSQEGRVVTAGQLNSEQGRQVVDYWSRQIIKTYQTRDVGNKGNVNYDDNNVRNQEFINARFNALWNQDAKSYETLGEVYNDWNKGVKAEESFRKAVDINANLKDTYDFQLNLAEANRLMGKYDKAREHITLAFGKDLSDRRAYYTLAKIDISQALAEPFNSTKLFDEARVNLSRSLQDDVRGKGVKREVAERELDAVVNVLGRKFLRENLDWVNSEKQWFQGTAQQSQGTVPQGVTYTGAINIDLPNLKLSGDATMYIIGNQFKIKSGSKIITGRIVGNTTGNMTAVSLKFDDPSLSGLQQSENITLSSRSFRQARQFVIRDTQSTQSGFNFTARMRE